MSATAMCPYAVPFLATVALWWSSTGLILMLDSRDRRTYAATMAGATVVLGGALWLVWATAGETTAEAAYVAFAGGLAAWGWQLLAFYTGFLTGPNRRPCIAGSSDRSRFLQAFGASLYHEIAAIAGTVALFAITRGEPNKIALWTYLILWLMHLSAKLNLFLGVPNLGTEMLPDHLAYLTSYMARRPMNDLFPVSVTVGVVASAVLFFAAARSTGGFEVAAFAMLGSLVALAVVEHWFLVVSLDGNALWRAFRRVSPNRAVETAVRVEQALAVAPEVNSGLDTIAAEGGAFRANPPKICNARNVERLLDAIAAGRFGSVDCLHGLVRTEAQWICFELREGRARVAALAPKTRTPLVIARGREFDHARLRAAFEGCAASA